MGKFTSLACRGVQRRSLWQGQLITNQRWQPTCCQSLYGSPGASWQDKRSDTRCKHLVYLVCQICGCDTVSGMPDRGLKGAKAPSQVSKVSRQAITLGNLQKYRLPKKRGGEELPSVGASEASTTTHTWEFHVPYPIP